jgi:hypothetical protein
VEEFVEEGAFAGVLGTDDGDREVIFLAVGEWLEDGR